MYNLLVIYEMYEDLTSVLSGKTVQWLLGYLLTSFNGGSEIHVALW